MKEMKLDSQARVAPSHIFGGHDKGGVQQLADENQMDVMGQKEGSPGVKAKALQGSGPRGSPGVTSHTPGNVRKCEGV